VLIIDQWTSLATSAQSAGYTFDSTNHLYDMHLEWKRDAASGSSSPGACVRQCMHVCVCVYTFGHTHTHTYTHVHTRTKIYVHSQINMYIYICVCIYIYHMSIYIYVPYVYIYTHMYMYIHTYLHMHVRIYTYVRVHCNVLHKIFQRPSFSPAFLCASLPSLLELPLPLCIFFAPTALQDSNDNSVFSDVTSDRLYYQEMISGSPYAVSVSC